jgi:molecular chaperone DnaK
MTATEVDLLLMDKGYTQDMIDQVLCAGSSTRLEMVRDMLNAKFPGKVNLNIDPDQCVAQGAALYASLSVPGPIPKMCAPYALGVAARDHTGQKHVYPLIVKDQKLPCTESDESFSTGKHNLTSVLVEIYELEAYSKDETKAPEGCNKLGEVLVEGLPPGRPAYQPVEITFSFDSSFLLSVVAKDLNSNTDASTNLNIGSGLDGLTREKTRKMLEGMEIKS